ncbi:hypothetical protein ACVWYH_003096 [Bradyrhizobium sp. GM24.11]
MSTARFRNILWAMPQSMAKQPDVDKRAHPTTSVEFRQARAALSVRERELQNEGAALYAAIQKGSPPPRPLTDHEARVREHIKTLLNGATPSHLLAPVASRDEQIRAEIDAIRFADRHWGKLEEEAAQREAQQFADDRDSEWRALCREIVLTALKLEAFEARAREMLEPIRGFSVNVAMWRTIGSDLSLLGVGDPLADMRNDALQQGIVSAADVRKASNVR